MIALLTKVMIVLIVTLAVLIFLALVVPQMLSAPSLEDNIGGALLGILGLYGLLAASFPVGKWLLK